MYYVLESKWIGYLVIFLLEGGSIFLLLDSFYLHYIQTPSYLKNYLCILCIKALSQPSKLTILLHGHSGLDPESIAV